MSIYTEIKDEYGIDPSKIYRIMDGYLNSSLPAWNLPEIDILDIWGSMSLRAAVGLLTGGDTPTTYTKRMSDMIRLITDKREELTLLGLDEPPWGDPVQADFTRALDVVRSLRDEPIEAEVVDE
jgi:hypothetical protein